MPFNKKNFLKLKRAWASNVNEIRDKLKILLSGKNDSGHGQLESELTENPGSTQETTTTLQLQAEKIGDLDQGRKSTTLNNPFFQLLEHNVLDNIDHSTTPHSRASNLQEFVKNFEFSSFEFPAKNYCNIDLHSEEHANINLKNPFSLLMYNDVVENIASDCIPHAGDSELEDFIECTGDLSVFEQCKASKALTNNHLKIGSNNTLVLNKKSQVGPHKIIVSIDLNRLKIKEIGLSNHPRIMNPVEIDDPLSIEEDDILNSGFNSFGNNNVSSENSCSKNIEDGKYFSSDSGVEEGERFSDISVTLQPSPSGAESSIANWYVNCLIRLK